MKNVLFACALGAIVGCFAPNVFEDRKVWCLPYEISMDKQAERGIYMTEVGRMFAPESGIEHPFFCYQKSRTYQWKWF